MKVAIIGGAKRTKDLAPYNDDEWEKWVLGVHIDKYESINRIFEIHDDLSFAEDGYETFLASKNIPLYVSKEFPIKADNIKVYPKEEVESQMRGHLTSSIAYMFGLAILEGATHINLYGVEMNVDDREYFYQRPGIYAWRGYAQAKGIIVDAPQSSLFVEKQYPEWTLESGIPPYTQEQFLRMSFLHQEKIDHARVQIKKLDQYIDTHSGCKQVYERLAKIARATDAGIDIASIEESTEIRS